MGIIHPFTMTDAHRPVQTTAARDINSGHQPTAERRARLTVFDGIPLPTKAGGKIYGLPMKSLTLHAEASSPHATPFASLARHASMQDQTAAAGEAAVAPMHLSITTAQAVQTGLPCAF